MTVALVALGVLVRAPRLTESLWYDEIAAWRDYGMLGPKAILSTYFDPANHIAHTLLTWISVGTLTGALGQEIALRAPALVFSLGTILVMPMLARRAGLTPRAALLAAGLAAVAPVMILEGVEARGYSMMIFFAAATTTQLLAALDDRRRGPWIAYGALCALGIWAHPTTVCVPVGHALWLAARCRRERGVCGPAAIGLGFGALLTLALYAPVLDDVARIRGTFVASEGNQPSATGIEGLHALLQLGGSWAWWAAAPGLLLAAIGVVAAWRNESARRAVALTLLGLPVMIAVVLIAGTWMYARFTLFALPGTLLLIALGLDTIWRCRAWTGALALTLLLAAFAADLVTRPPKQPLRDAAEYVAANRRDGERTLVIGLRHEVLDVYAGTLAPTYSLHHGSDLRERLDETDPTWVIVLYPRSISEDRYDRLREHGYTIEHSLHGWADWTNGDVNVYRRRQESAVNRAATRRSDPAGSR